jgi:hypothetical protein
MAHIRTCRHMQMYNVVVDHTQGWDILLTAFLTTFTGSERVALYIRAGDPANAKVSACCACFVCPCVGPRQQPTRCDALPR